jgi:hypothetical protein
MPPPYAVDSSIWIRVWRYHPPDIFVNLWEQLRASVAAGHIWSPDEVLHELQKGDDDLADTLEAMEGLFLPLDELVQAAVTRVMSRCPDLADSDGERNRADPFVVAVGLVRSATVVTGERPRRSPEARRRIPDACIEMDLVWLDWFAFLKDVGWRL